MKRARKVLHPHEDALRDQLVIAADEKSRLLEAASGVTPMVRCAFAMGTVLGAVIGWLL